MTRTNSWKDLGPRLGGAVVLAAVAALAVGQGGLLLALLILALVGVMLWELWQMLDQSGMGMRSRAGYMVLAAAVIGLAGLVHFLALSGGMTDAPLPRWILGLWLVLVVIATDVAGYFGGKIIGGPKVWPRISPKKTWAGTLSGWAAAVLVAGIVAVWAGLPQWQTWLAAGLIVSLFSQAGDFAESAIKRHLGVKDSSQLIPGHGGFCDRFDGMIGGAYGLLVAYPFLSLPVLLK